MRWCPGPSCWKKAWHFRQLWEKASLQHVKIIFSSNVSVKEKGTMYPLAWNSHPDIDLGTWSLGALKCFSWLFFSPKFCSYAGWQYHPGERWIRPKRWFSSKTFYLLQFFPVKFHTCWHAKRNLLRVTLVWLGSCMERIWGRVSRLYGHNRMNSWLLKLLVVLTLTADSERSLKFLLTSFRQAMDVHFLVLLARFLCF